MRRALLHLFLCIALPSLGQTIAYSGRIVTDGGAPLGQVSVVAANGGMKTVAFARSKADGTFEVKVSPDKEAQWLICSKMGYGRDTLALATFRSGQTITLHEAAVEIKEVKVKAQPIREEGDTLNYNVAAFQQKQDRSIADVIKKMPGMKVNEDGSIEYDGKKINNFYVEGMDLTGAKYAQVSENLQADKVKKVQVLRNHQPVKALKNINFSEQAALNIVLKDDARNVWQGFADLAGGHSLQGEGRWLGDDRLMLMQFARKRQSISMYKFNNTGKDISREVLDIGSLSDYAPMESGLLSNIALGAPSLDKRHSTFNQTHMVATNWLFKTRGQNDLRVQLNGLLDKGDQNRLTETVYTDVMGGATVVEDVTATSHADRLNGEVQYKVNRDSLYVNNSLKGHIDFKRSNGLSLDGHGGEIRESVKPRQRSVADQLRIVRTIGRRSYRLNAYFSYNNLPSQLLLTDGAWQRLDLQSVLWGATTGYGRRVGRIDVNWTLNEDAKYQRLDTQHPTADSRNKYDEYKTKLTTALSYRNEEWRVNLDLPLSWLARRLDDRSRSDALLEPRLYVNYQPTPKWEFHTTYNYAWSPLDVKQSAPVPVYTTYLSMRRGNGQFDNTCAHAVYADAQYHHALKGFFASMRFHYAALQHQPLYRSALTSTGVYQQEATDRHTHSDNWQLTGRVSEGFSFGKFTTAIEAGIGRNNYRVLLADVLTPSRMDTRSLQLNLSAQPVKWFSVEEASTYDYSRQTVSGTHHDPLQSFSHQLKLFVMPGDWQVQWITDLYHSNDRTVNTCVFSDLAVSYRKKRYEAGIYCNNLFGNRRYERRTVSTTQAVYTMNRLRPREIMARIYFNL
ncbi:MAG: TonB-dependent receptor [Prevotella sp.]|nr:TonB-dependent receptor [Prevotella sp.]